MTPDAMTHSDKTPDASRGLSLLEQVRATARTACTNPKSPRLIGRDETARKAVWVKAYCKMWDCETCAARKAQYWIATTINGINKLGGKWWFVTLTAASWARGTEESLNNIRAGWSKLYDRMRRKHGGKFHYVKVWEYHEDDTLHLHLITDCKLPYSENNDKGSKWLSDAAASCGMGWKTDYQPCKHGGFAAHYVAKYLGKQALNGKAGRMPKNLHRIRTSNNFPSLPDLSEDDDVVWSYEGQRDVDALVKMLHWYGRGFDMYDQRGIAIQIERMTARLILAGMHPSFAADRVRLAQRMRRRFDQQSDS